MVSIRYKLPCILYAISLVYASSIKGVEPKKQDLYTSSKDGTWTCLDGSKTIAYTAINDDYCDCADGSDEPGTSACSNALFYCANHGHIPAYIKSSAVNDGVCDDACCDGSDENGDLIHCPNRCQEVGEAYRLAQSSLKQSTEAGLEVKKNLINEAIKQITLWQEEKAQIEDEIFLKKAHLLRLERERASLEKKNSEEACEESTHEVEALRQAVVVLQKNVNQLKTILSDMKRDHNHNYHDMAVKGAISAYDEFVERYSKLEKEISNQLEEHGLEDDVSEDEEKPSDEALENVRKLINDAENELSDLNNNFNKLKGDLEADYGTENEWLKLKDTCIKKDEGEYTYSLCILGDAHQESNKDKTRIHLGNFDTFEGMYSVHSHTHGTRCWNGPDRSVKVFFECGSENEILSVTEPEKCEYHFTAKSPAVCQSIPDMEETVEHKKPVHEEL